MSRRIFGSDLETFTITVYPGFPSPIQTGDTGEIYNRRQNGYRRSEYKAMINSAIQNIASNAPQPDEELIIPIYDANNPLVLVTSLDWVCKVQYLDYDGEWKDVRPYSPQSFGYGWHALRQEQTITIGPEWSSYLNGKSIKLIGYKESGMLVADSDTTSLDPEWIKEIVRGEMQTANPDNAGNIGPGQWRSSRADAIRAKGATLLQANCKKVS